MKFKDISEVVNRSNTTCYGLGAAVFTKDINKAIMISNSIKAGTIWWVNYVCNFRIRILRSNFDLRCSFLKLFLADTFTCLFSGNWYPCFGFLMTSPLGFKATVGSALSECRGRCNVHSLRSTSGATHCQPLSSRHCGSAQCHHLPVYSPSLGLGSNPGHMHRSAMCYHYTMPACLTQMFLKLVSCLYFRVNNYLSFFANAPFGGYKMSGIGRELWVFCSDSVNCEAQKFQERIQKFWRGGVRNMAILTMLCTTGVGLWIRYWA